MVDRGDFYAESLKEDQAATLTEKVSLTLPSGLYWCFYSARVSSIGKMPVLVTAGPRSVSFRADLWETVFGFFPCTGSVSLKFSGGKCSDAVLWAIRKDPEDRYAESLPETDTDRLEPQDKVALIVEAGSVVIAAAEIGDNGPGVEVWANLGQYGDARRRPRSQLDRFPWAAMYQANSDHTARLQYRTKDGFGERAYMRGAAILALKGFDYAESRTPTLAGINYRTKLTAQGGPYVIAMGMLHVVHASERGSCRLTFDGIGLTEHVQTSPGGNETGHVFAAIRRGTGTWGLEVKSDTSALLRDCAFAFPKVWQFTPAIEPPSAPAVVLPSWGIEKRSGRERRQGDRRRGERRSGLDRRHG